MLFYIAAYVFIALATTIAVYNDDNPRRGIELIASAIAGALWPLLFTVRIIVKTLR
jgi:hypothetical protein